MFSIGKKKLVGIDIGSDSIKAVKLKGITNNEISAIAIKKISCESNEDVLFETLSKEGLKEIAKTRGFSQNPCASIITDPSLSYVNMKLPTMPKDEIIEAVKFEAKKELTYPVSEAIVDYIVKDKPTTEDPMYSITAIAVKKDAIYNHIDSLKEAGFKPEAVEIGAIPLMAAFDHNHSWDPSKKTVLLDIGASKSHMLIVKDRSLRFYRDLPVCGGSFTNAFKEIYGLNYAEADEKKINMLGHEEGIKKELTDVKDDKKLHSLYEGLALELQRSFDYYQARYREGPVNEIVLSGGGALLEYIDGYLEEILGMQVTIDNPFSKLYFSNEKDEEEYSKVAPLFTTAVGLALRKV